VVGFFVVRYCQSLAIEERAMANRPDLQRCLPGWCRGGEAWGSRECCQPWTAGRTPDGRGKGGDT